MAAEDSPASKRRRNKRPKLTIEGAIIVVLLLVEVSTFIITRYVVKISVRVK